MYDPTIGRFTELDPIGFEAGDANLYRYVGNGPTNATDPMGLQSSGQRAWQAPPVFPSYPPNYPSPEHIPTGPYDHDAPGTSPTIYGPPGPNTYAWMMMWHIHNTTYEYLEWNYHNAQLSSRQKIGLAEAQLRMTTMYIEMQDSGKAPTAEELQRYKDYMLIQAIKYRNLHDLRRLRK